MGFYQHSHSSEVCIFTACRIDRKKNTLKGGDLNVEIQTLGDDSFEALCL